MRHMIDLSADSVLAAAEALLEEIAPGAARALRPST